MDVATVMFKKYIKEELPNLNKRAEFAVLPANTNGRSGDVPFTPCAEEISYTDVSCILLV